MSKLNNTIFFVCNQGGHYSQMMALKSLFSKYESVLVTDNKRASIDLLELSPLLAVEKVMDMANKRDKQAGKSSNSRLAFLPAYISQFFHCRKVWKKYRPAVIITTGSNLAVPMFYYGWLKGSKLVFIETRAKVTGKTLTGKLVAPLADKVIVQWPEMVDVYKGKAEYFGTLV